MSIFSVFRQAKYQVWLSRKKLNERVVTLTRFPASHEMTRFQDFLRRHQVF